MLMQALITKILDAIELQRAEAQEPADALYAELNRVACSDFKQTLAMLKDKYAANQEQVSEQALQPLVELVKRHADRVRSNNANPTVMPNLYSNLMSSVVASQISEQMPDKFPSRMHLLFYYLKVKKSASTGKELASLSPREFILTDDADAFIEILPAFRQFKNKGKFLVTSLSSQRELSQAEQDRLIHYSAATKECYQNLAGVDTTEIFKKTALDRLGKSLRDGFIPASSYGAAGIKDVKDKLFADAKHLMGYMLHAKSNLYPAKWQGFLQEFNPTTFQKIMLGDKSFAQALESYDFSQNDKDNRLYLYCMTEVYWKNRAASGAYTTYGIPGYYAAVNAAKHAMGVPDKETKFHAVKLFEAFLESHFKLDEFDLFLDSLRIEENALPVLKVQMNDQVKSIEVDKALISALKDDKTLSLLFKYASHLPQRVAARLAEQAAVQVQQPKVA